jgi:acetyl-CoA carboxylase biotin carboxyl carrier protein
VAELTGWGRIVEQWARGRSKLYHFNTLSLPGGCESAAPCLTLLPKPLYLDAATHRRALLEIKDIKEIKAIIDLMKKNDLSVFEIEKDGFRLRLQKGTASQTTTPSPPIVITAPKPATTTAETATAADKTADTASLKDIVSPMVGTFYRAGSPDAGPFVDIGKPVTEDSVVCIIEAMKVMNEIKAETSGVIAEIVAENGKPVQFGQVLFRVR